MGHIPPATVNKILTEIIGHRSLNPQRVNAESADREYQRTFKGQPKGDLVVQFVGENCPNLPFDRLAYVSIGGGEGDEMYIACKKLGIRHAILMEYMSAAAATANSRMKPLIRNGLRFESFVGDAAQRLGDATDTLEQWRIEDDLLGVIVSAQAVLHELPTRADLTRWHTNRVFSLYCDMPVGVFHSREPVQPSESDDWSQAVFLSIAGANGELLYKAAETLRGKLIQQLPHDQRPPFDGQLVSWPNGRVQMPGPLAVELLHKVIRYDGTQRLMHEMDECLVSLDARDMSNRVGMALTGNANSFAPEYTCTRGFKEAYSSYSVEAFTADNGLKRLSAPNCFAVIAGWFDRSGDAQAEERRVSASTAPASGQDDAPYVGKSDRSNRTSPRRRGARTTTSSQSAVIVLGYSAPFSQAMEVLGAIRSELAKHGITSLEILDVRQGSVVVKLRMSWEDAEKLRWLIEEGRIAGTRIVSNPRRQTLQEMTASEHPLARQLAEATQHNEQPGYSEGVVLSVVVTRLAPFGAFVELPSGEEGLIHVSELSDGRVSCCEDVVAVGQTISARILRILEDGPRLSLKGLPLPNRWAWQRLRGMEHREPSGELGQTSAEPDKKPGGRSGEAW